MSSRTHSPLRAMFGSPTPPTPNMSGESRDDGAPIRATATGVEGGRAVECTVTQLTPFGARIASALGCALPDRMRLQIPLRHIDSGCRVFWRGANSVGVRFVN